MITTTNVLLTCDCGLLPLDQAQHATSQDAWNAAAKHVALNPDKCKPSMTKVDVPVALSA